MRVVEHRPVACVPSGDVLRCLPISGLQTRWAHRLESLCSAYTGLSPQAPDVHPRTKNHAQRVGKPQHDSAIQEMHSTDLTVLRFNDLMTGNYAVFRAESH